MKIGILTFHGSHNHGSVLQAYATQKVVEMFGYDTEIINFRMKSQKEYYSLYPRGYGHKIFIQDLLMFPMHKQRVQRANKFEKFIAQMHLSGPEMRNREDLQSIVDRYDVYMSGSDQIWSNRIPELLRSQEDFTGVYFFDFADNDKPRISYASSVGEITYDELIEKKEWLEKYDFISTREQYGVDLLKRIIDKDVELVLDPTFLLNKDEWSDLAGKERLIKEPYVLLYTLHGLKHGIKWGKALTEFRKKSGINIVAVSPFFPVMTVGIHNVIDAGPLDFLNLIKYAELVFTDSFHGTAFSINMNKPFFSYIGKNTGDNRKLGIMRQFGLEDRALEVLDEVNEIDNITLDYEEYNNVIESARERSIEALKLALKRLCPELL